MVISLERETMLQRQLQQGNLISVNATLKSELSRLNSKISSMSVQFGKDNGTRINLLDLEGGFPLKKMMREEDIMGVVE
jgi:hypothetical protein